MYIDDQTRRIRQQKGVVIRQILHLENHTGLSALKLGYANFLKETIVHIESLANQGGSELGIQQVEENTIWTIDTLRLELDILLEIDGDTRIVGRRPVPDAGNPRQLDSLCLGGAGLGGASAFASIYSS